MTKATSGSPWAPSPLYPFRHEEILQTAMPMGGIGAGCICLNGYGGLQDFAIRHRPDFSSLPDTHFNCDCAFALLHVRGSRAITRLVEGPIPGGKIYDQGLQAQGYRKGGHEGLPRFRRSTFSSGYPFGRIKMSDPKVPVSVEVTGWSPLIPLDDIASGIPCAILEYTLRNKSAKQVDVEFSYHLSHLAVGRDTGNSGTRNQVIPGKGAYLYNTEASDSETCGSASLTVVGRRPAIKAMWLRGGWFDAISALWREVEGGQFRPNNGRTDAGRDGRNGASIMVSASLATNEETTIPIVITWHYPNSEQAYGCAEETGGGAGCDCKKPKWRPFYVSQWQNARDVATYVHRNYYRLRNRTIAFQNALLSSTLPAEALDAISANLAILKSPTVLRQENGHLWGWEGCFTSRGCCHGSCTHVWNYAQAFPHLFPKLERTLREQEYKRSMDDSGYVNFRSALPDGPPGSWGVTHAATDGQLGGIMKLYRDWQISGDLGWLRELYPLARRSIEYCINKWDPERRGGLFEPHHNTYDIEFWGPDGMCGSIYVGALSAISFMALALDEGEDHQVFGELARRAARFMEENLFNGEYFEQIVQYYGLNDRSFADLVSGKGAWSGSQEMLGLLKKEGPRYQYGKGCLSDGIVGAWMARIYGIEIPLDLAKIRRSLRSIYRFNFRRTFEDHANCQRPGYATAREGGLLLCSWPKGGKPILPFPYSDEVWTGIEYQVASHLIAEGMIEEGLDIVRTVRKRYDGRIRNPWNEYECGSYYARAMSSYALLASLSGFQYSAVDKTLRFAPTIKRRPFRAFFSTATAYGTIVLESDALTVSVAEGKLSVECVALACGKRTFNLSVNAVVSPGKPKRFALVPAPEMRFETKP